MALGEHVALEPLEPADHLVQEAAHLGEVAGDRDHLAAEPLLDGLADLGGERGGELGGGLGEALDLVARALQRGLDRAGVGAAFCCGLEPLSRALDRVFVHGEQG